MSVAVVGNGPVGQTTALLLAKWRVPVVLLDARPFRDREGSRAICQQRDVLDVWDSLGAGTIAQEGLTWTTARTFHGTRELHSWSFVDRGRSPLPPFVNLAQHRTEAVLDELIARQPLIDVRWNREVLDLEQDAAGVRLHCAAEDVAADFAVVAAGAHARGLRDCLGVRFEGESFGDRFLICDVRVDLPDWASERRFYFDPPWNPGRQVLVHPTPDGIFRLDWQVPADFDLEADDLERRVESIVGEAPYEIVWRTVYRFSSLLADRLRVGRVLLAGDAAHLMAPFGARGLNSGVADAENAAWKVAAVYHGWAPPELLETYELERRAAALENLTVTGATMRLLAPADEAQWTARRQLLAAAAADPAAAAAIDSGRFAEPYWYVDSPLTTPCPARPFAGRPPKGHAPAPGPGILIPDVPIGSTRLRRLVRDGILVLVTGGFDADALAKEVAAAVSAPARTLYFTDQAMTVGDDNPHSHAFDLGDGEEVREVLGAGPDEAWVVRPDGHVAAVVRAAEGAAGVVAAVRRALALG
ncbi:MAG: FAD-dependent monooxygenase [Sporichthyaceae bacterium]